MPLRKDGGGGSAEGRMAAVAFFTGYGWGNGQNHVEAESEERRTGGGPRADVR
jgi:hypothetical protein